MSHKRIEHPKYITISLDSEESLLVLLALQGYGTPVSEKLIKEIQSDLRPQYVYDVKCKDCPRVYETFSYTEIPESRVKEGGICNNCMDDYK